MDDLSSSPTVSDLSSFNTLSSATSSGVVSSTSGRSFASTGSKPPEAGSSHSCLSFGFATGARGCFLPGTALGALLPLRGSALPLAGGVLLALPPFSDALSAGALALPFGAGLPAGAFSATFFGAATAFPAGCFEVAAAAGLGAGAATGTSTASTTSALITAASATASVEEAGFDALFGATLGFAAALPLASEPALLGVTLAAAFLGVAAPFGAGSAFPLAAALTAGAGFIVLFG
mmetsp:Transcript_36876/g.98220  ORF Transcript_36876/g.98220 Transcript_36876/m.98220 type:complete len:235 (+) Transcript_36876:425-1129(+)